MEEPAKRHERSLLQGPSSVGSRSRRAVAASICLTVPEALASLLRTVVVALFLLTFVLQPFLIPSESMEHTLLVGDFLLVNKQVFAPSGRSEPVAAALSRGGARRYCRLPSSPPAVCWSSAWSGIPGDRLRIHERPRYGERRALDEPYAAFEPAPRNLVPRQLSRHVYTDPQVDPDWWRQMQSLTHNGELVVPAGRVFRAGR